MLLKTIVCQESVKEKLKAATNVSILTATSSSGLNKATINSIVYDTLVKALIDTGSTLSIIDFSIAN